MDRLASEKMAAEIESQARTRHTVVIHSHSSANELADDRSFFSAVVVVVVVVVVVGLARPAEETIALRRKKEKKRKSSLTDDDDDDESPGTPRKIDVFVGFISGRFIIGSSLMIFVGLFVCLFVCLFVLFFFADHSHYGRLPLVPHAFGTHKKKPTASKSMRSDRFSAHHHSAITRRQSIVFLFLFGKGWGGGEGG